MRTFTLVLLFMGVVSIAQMWPTPSQPWAGVITDVDGAGIRVGNGMNPGGIWIDVTGGTRVDGDRRALRRNAYVRVLYARNGGSAVARRVTILPDDPRLPLRQTQKDLRQ